ncbi:transposase [Actinomadura sp. NBRC 104425]|uniref:transposase n=1 Tax=Actinomadura sp. NBRC 104425 TaxID=3032204 RepID=UPI0033238AC4
MRGAGRPAAVACPPGRRAGPAVVGVPGGERRPVSRGVGRCCRPPGGRGRPSKRTKRQLIDGIRRRVRTGAPLRDVPECHDSWQAVHGLFRRWQREGVLACILAVLRVGGRCRAFRRAGERRSHHHAGASARRRARRRDDLQREPPDGTAAEPGDHWAAPAWAGDQGALPPCEQEADAVVAGGDGRQRGDAPHVEAVMAGIRAAPDRGVSGPGRI